MAGKALKAKIAKMEEELLAGLRVYFDAHWFVKRYRLRRYLLITGLLFLILFTVSIKLLLLGVNYLEKPATELAMPYLKQFLNFSENDILKGFEATFWLIKKVIESNKFAIFGSLFLIIGTPFLSFISSKTEQLLSGRIYPFKWRVFFKEIRRGISISLRNTFKQLFWFLLITIVGLIPYVNTFTPLFIFIVQAYYNGILLTDYTLERKGVSVKDSQKFYKANKTQMFALGLGFMFLLLIPVLGWFLAPMYGIVAATLRFANRQFTNSLDQD